MHPRHTAPFLALVATVLTTASVHAVERRQVTFQSADGTVLAGTFYDSPSIGPGVLYFSTCGGGRDELQSMLAKLSGAGPRVLAFDYRVVDGRQVTTGPDAVADAVAAYRFLVGRARVGSDSIGIFAVGCGARLAVELAGATGKIAVFAALSPEVGDLSDDAIGRLRSVPMAIFAADGEVDARRLFASNHHPNSQLTAYRREERQIDLFAKAPMIKNVIDDWWEQVYGGWAKDHPLLAAPEDQKAMP